MTEIVKWVDLVIEVLDGRLPISTRHPKSDEISIAAERRFLAPERILTRAVDTLSRTEATTGFDVSHPWVATSRGVRLLDEPGAENDRKQLRQDVELTDL
ncbi:MAG TPA: hypothetical protein PLI59_18010, partial [Candidatus Obscuribacter sp.]|nr:hypothetical protein [Candidatus Obscuribacter sp.]